MPTTRIPEGALIEWATEGAQTMRGLVVFGCHEMPIVHVLGDDGEPLPIKYAADHAKACATVDVRYVLRVQLPETVN